MSMVKMQGIQRKNFEWVIEQTQNLLLKNMNRKQESLKACAASMTEANTPLRSNFAVLFFQRKR